MMQRYALEEELHKELFFIFYNTLQALQVNLFWPNIGWGVGGGWFHPPPGVSGYNAQAML